MSTEPIPTHAAERRVDQPAEAKPGVSWWWLAPFALAVAATPFVWRPLLRMTTSLTTREAPGPATPASGSQIGFSATHEGSDWRLVWNRQVMARLEPIGAILTITDGGLDRQQFLSTRDLAAGAVVYVPRTSDLTFNLKVTIPNAPEIEEQIRVLGADGDRQADAASPPAPRRIYAETPRTESTANRAYTGQPVQTQAAAQPRRVFQPPTAPLVRVAPVEESAPALPNVGLPVASAPGIQGVAGTPAPPRPAPPKSVTPPQPAAPKPEPVVPRIVRTEASPLRSVTASWPRNVARDGGLEIKIKVEIDAKGRVTGVIPINRNVRNFAFVDSAVTAARMWTFAPAMENGKPVPSESVLTFKFNP